MAESKTPEAPSPTTSTAPAGDEQAKADEQAAELLETITLEWRDLRFLIPKQRAMWDANVQFEFEDGNRLRAICILLGGAPEAAGVVRAKITASAKTSGELDEFITHISKVIEKEAIG